MSGSKERAMPATLTRSPTGRGAAGMTNVFMVNMDRKATNMPDKTDTQFLAKARCRLCANEMAASMGFVRC
jgi:hypothetical protein